MKKVLACLLTCLLCLPLAACGEKPVQESSSDVSASQSDSYRIAAVFARDDEFARQVQAGMQAAIDEGQAEVTLDVQYAQGSKRTEKELLDALDPAKTQGVLCLPVSRDESIAVLNRAAERGLPVGIVGSAGEKAAFAKKAMACDPYALGQMAGEQAKKQIEGEFSGKANLAIVQNHGENRTESTLRVNGFLDALKELEGVTAVGELDLSAGDKPAEQLDAFLKDHNDIDLIFCTTGEGLVETHKALLAAKYKAALYGVDAYDEVLEILRAPDNTIQAVAVEDYHGMGYRVMNALLEAAKEPGKVVAGGTEAGGSLLITPEDSAAIAELEAKLV